MELTTEILAARKAMIDKFKGVVKGIEADRSEIDGSGDTLESVIGVVVQAMSPEIYVSAIEFSKNLAKDGADEADQIIGLLNSIIKKYDDHYKIEEAALAAAQRLGVSGIKWV